MCFSLLHILSYLENYLFKVVKPRHMDKKSKKSNYLKMALAIAIENRHPTAHLRQEIYTPTSTNIPTTLSDAFVPSFYQIFAYFVVIQLKIQGRAQHRDS